MKRAVRKKIRRSLLVLPPYMLILPFIGLLPFMLAIISRAMRKCICTMGSVFAANALKSLFLSSST